MKIAIGFAVAAAFVGALALGVHGARGATLESARAAVDAAAPEGVRILDVTLVDNRVHVIGTSRDQAKIARFLGQIEASEAFAAPDLEFNYALKAGGNAFSMIASTR